MRLIGTVLVLADGLVSGSEPIAGLYLVHWVLVVWFGDMQLNTIHSEETWGGREPGFGPLLRDIAIAAASLVITAVSFYKFEIPVMKRGANWQAATVIAIGFSTMAACAGLAMLVTSTGDVSTIPLTADARDSAFDLALEQSVELVRFSLHSTCCSFASYPVTCLCRLTCTWRTVLTNVPLSLSARRWRLAVLADPEKSMRAL